MSDKKKARVTQENPAPAAEEPAEQSAAAEASFPIVGIGASAGGLAAIEAFFAAMPAGIDSGMAFVVVQHLAPDRKSILIDLVKRYTKMQVYRVEDGMRVQRNCVYIIPPNRDMAFLHGRLHLLEPSATRGLRLPIDFFFCSLAQDQRDKAICVILSGTGSDGTLGLKAVKGEGGTAIVQSPESAAYDGMPRSAIATGLMDCVLPPNQMPQQLMAFVQHAFGGRPRSVAVPAFPGSDSLQKIFVLIRVQTGHDFSLYKQNSIIRRVERRMAVAQIDQMEDYVRYLRENPPEVEALFRELLIGVTNFFRDPHAFVALQEHALPRLFGAHAGGTRRVWVPGCSTGEEAYSLAILMREYLDERREGSPVQIFATDIDAQSIQTARAGVYPESIAADVSPERLARFFVKENSTYRISKSIRDMVVVAEQDVLKDPPFSHLDLISCRNLLIYLGAEAQKKLLLLFHYALHKGGYLFLGDSETIGDAIDLFDARDKKWRIYQRNEVVTRHAAVSPYRSAGTAEAAPAAREPLTVDGVRDLTQRFLLDAYVPAGVLINPDFEVLYIHGHTGKYLEPATGEASLNLLRMARESLRPQLTAAVHAAIAGQKAVRYDSLIVESNGHSSVVNLVVQPVTSLHHPASGSLMIIFEDVPAAAPEPTEAVGAPSSDQEQRIATLERQLRAKEEYLQTMIEELETANEELKSANEEMQSSNEELQSTNEEMETSQEELQSVNEELITVNIELRQKLSELSQANSDMTNLMASTRIGTVFVDYQLRIQRFTPEATRVFRFIQTDIGRPLSDIASLLASYDHLEQDTRQVLTTLVPVEIEVQSQEGQWFQMRIQPYRTVENVIEGAVLTFVEITELKLLQLGMSANEEKLRTLFELLPVGVCALDAEGKVVYANPALEKIFDLPGPALLGSECCRQRHLRRDGTPMPPEELACKRAISEQRAVHHVEAGRVKDDGSVIWVDVSAAPIALLGWSVIVVHNDLPWRFLVGA